MNGPLIILSGPTASGKSTIVAHLLAMPELRLKQSVSATTRPPRPSERHGVDYYFVDEAEFRRMRDAGELLEWAEVHGKFYGTPRKPVEELRRQGFAVVLVIDVQGAAQVRRVCPDVLSIFVRASTLNILEQRLRDRCTEDEATLQTRLTTARGELLRAHEYDHQVINDDLEQAVLEVRTIIMNRIREGEHAG